MCQSVSQSVSKWPRKPWTDRQTNKQTNRHFRIYISRDYKGFCSSYSDVYKIPNLIVLYSSLRLNSRFTVVRKKVQLAGACNYPKYNTSSFFFKDKPTSLWIPILRLVQLVTDLRLPRPIKKMFFLFFFIFFFNIVCFVNNYFCFVFCSTISIFLNYIFCSTIFLVNIFFPHSFLKRLITHFECVTKARPHNLSLLFASLQDSVISDLNWQRAEINLPDMTLKIL